MPQGMRFGRARAIFASVGVTLCAGLLGCNSTDKPKTTTTTTPPLQGTPYLNSTTGPSSSPYTGTATTGTAAGATSTTRPYSQPSQGFPAAPGTSGAGGLYSAPQSTAAPTSASSFSTSGTPTGLAGSSATAYGSTGTLSGTSMTPNASTPSSFTSSPSRFGSSPTGLPPTGAPGSLGVPQFPSTSGGSSYNTNPMVPDLSNSITPPQQPNSFGR